MIAHTQGIDTLSVSLHALMHIKNNKEFVEIQLLDGKVKKKTEKEWGAFGQVNRCFHYPVVTDCYKYMRLNFCQRAFADAGVGFGLPTAERLTPSPSTPERRASYRRRNRLRTATNGMGLSTTTCSKLYKLEGLLSISTTYMSKWRVVFTWCTLKANRTP